MPRKRPETIKTELDEDMVDAVFILLNKIAK